MLRILCAAALAFALATAADARPRKAGTHSSAKVLLHRGDRPDVAGRARAPARARRIADPRPRAWCGWWMRRHLGVADRSFNLARRWANYGTSAHGPAIGTIVVWRHHVGIITGGSAGRWIVKSGNDSRAVRERQRSLAGAIAFRWPNGAASYLQMPRRSAR